MLFYYSSRSAFKICSSFISWIRLPRYACDRHLWQYVVCTTVLHTTEMVQVASLRRTLARCHQQGHVGSEALLQQNHPVLNWVCQQTQVVLYNGHKMVVVVVAAVATVQSYAHAQLMGLLFLSCPTLDLVPQKRTFSDYCMGFFFQARCPACHPINSVKVLKETPN